MAVRTPKNSLRRRPAKRQPKTTFLIFTEGEATEPDYLRGLARALLDEDRVNVDVCPSHGTPMTLVNYAVDNLDRGYAELWCVFDVECPQQHPLLAEAVAKAKRHGIKVAYSNPCFEYWLMLHFDAHSSHLTTVACESKSRGLDGRVKKRLEFAVYLDQVDRAAKRALDRQRWHADNGTTFPHDNPSTTFDRLVRRLLEFRKA